MSIHSYSASSSKGAFSIFGLVELGKHSHQFDAIAGPPKCLFSSLNFDSILSASRDIGISGLEAVSFTFSTFVNQLLDLEYGG